MIRPLEQGRRGPKQGRAERAVVFLHGYGADGQDLLGLAEPMAPHLPGTVFVAPNAPERCTNNPMGYQWFPIPWLDGSSQEDAEAGMVSAAADLNAYLDGLMRDEGLTPDRVALIGFSQGTMMSLHVAPRRAAALAAVVGFSGRLMVPDLLADEAVSRFPVLLLHGDRDDVVPFGSMQQAAEALVAAEFETYAYVMQGTAHGIAPDGLGQAVAFLRKVFGIDAG